MLFKIIYKLGQKYRNPSLKKYYTYLKDTEFKSKKELKEIQLNNLKNFLIFVNKYSPYYQEIFKKNNFDVFKISSIKDLENLPILSKKDLIKNNTNVHTLYKFRKKFLSETSGTSGEALKFYRNEEWDSRNRAALFRSYDWYGVKPWDNNGYFWGYNIDKKKVFLTKILDSLQNRFRVFSYKEDEINSFLKKLSKAKYVHGYSSMIYEVAKIINLKEERLDYDNIKMIKGTSEKIYDSYQNEVKKAFGKNIISEYGASEAGLIAYECPKGYMHINIENVIIEIFEGEIVVTNLMSKSFPIIRYKLGDSVKLADESFICKCGRNHPVILDVLGRVGKKIFGKKNKYPSLTFYYVFKNLVLNKDIKLNYQAIQNEKGKVLLNIEQDNKKVLSYLKEELKKYFGNDIDFEINFGVKLHSMDGKLKDFITSLN